LPGDLGDEMERSSGDGEGVTIDARTNKEKKEGKNRAKWRPEWGKFYILIVHQMVLDES